MKGECLLPQGQVHAIIYQVWLGQAKLGFVRTDILDLSEQSVVFGGIRQFTVERDEFFIPILMEFGIRQSKLKKLQEFVVPNLKKCVIPSRKNALVYTSLLGCAELTTDDSFHLAALFLDEAVDKVDIVDSFLDDLQC